MPAPTDEQMRELVQRLLPPHSRERFEQRHEADFPHTAEGIGRFRINIFQQRGVTLNAIFCQRLVPTRAGGVVPAVEILRNNSTVRNLFETGQLDKLNVAIETGGDDGMQTFNRSFYKPVKAGLITEQEALAKSTTPQQLAMSLRGIFVDESRRIMASG